MTQVLNYGSAIVPWPHLIVMHLNLVYERYYLAFIHPLLNRWKLKEDEVNSIVAERYAFWDSIGTVFGNWSAQLSIKMFFVNLVSLELIYTGYACLDPHKYREKQR